MDTRQIKKELIHIIRKDFNGNLLGEFRSASASNNMYSEVEFRLMKNITELDVTNNESVNAIIADVNLAHSMGWMTEESFKKSLKLIEEIK